MTLLNAFKTNIKQKLGEEAENVLSEQFIHQIEIIENKFNSPKEAIQKFWRYQIDKNKYYRERLDSLLIGCPRGFYRETLHLHFPSNAYKCVLNILSELVKNNIVRIEKRLRNSSGLRKRYSTLYILNRGENKNE